MKELQPLATAPAKSKPKRAWITRAPKIDRINIRRQRFGLVGIVYSDGNTWLVRFAPNTVVTEALVEKCWQKDHRSFRPCNEEGDQIHF